MTWHQFVTQPVTRNVTAYWLPVWIPSSFLLFLLFR